MKTDEILAWLRERDTRRLEKLWKWADEVRRKNVGDEVHLRGLVEVSNNCVRQCGYCGLRAGNKKLRRYRMSEEEIMDCVAESERYGYGTVVLQAGEDYGISTDWLAGIIYRIKTETPLAVTLSMGERPDSDLAAWRQAGANRYLLRFETSDADLFQIIHPRLSSRAPSRLDILRTLKELNYEIGGGVMVGIPGQTFSSLANDIDIFRKLDLDMIGIGPYIPHPSTPMGSGKWKRIAPKYEQVPNTAEMTCKVIALARIVCPESNIPSTNALAAITPAGNREPGLLLGANVVMSTLTPSEYRVAYEIYPARANIKEATAALDAGLKSRIRSIRRQLGQGQGNRVHPERAGHAL